MRNSLLVVALLLIQSPLWAGIFSWVDASGNIVYGDNPPEAVAAEPIVPSKLTILENFANRYEDSANTSRSVNARLVAKEAVKSPLAQKAVINAYSSLAIIAPKPNQLIRASDGDVSVAVSMSPKLKGSDTLVLFLNGQEHSRVKSRVINLNNLDRGEYTLTTEIQSANGHSLLRSDKISFIVQRGSTINKPYNPYSNESVR